MQSSKASLSVFSIKKIFETLPEFSRQGITELSISDRQFSRDKNGILRLVSQIKKFCPELFVSILVSPEILDKTLIQEFQEIYCSL